MAQARKLHDRYFLQAKADGYAARSAYKLIDIDDRKHILRKGHFVVDLGCAPGSWVQVASQRVGDTGRVVGIDLKPVNIRLPFNARTIVGDIFKVSAEELLAVLELPEKLPDGRPVPPPPPPFKVVLSDMAPNTEGGGGGSGDHLRSVQLCRRVLELVPKLLKVNGHMVVKVFEGEVYPDLMREVEELFTDVKGFKPEASRDVSREMFIIAKGFRPKPEAPAPANRDPHAIAPPAPKPRAGWGHDKIDASPDDRAPADLGRGDRARDQDDQSKASRRRG